MVTETIFNGKNIIPMDEVSHIERDGRKGYEDGISIIFKHSTWNYEGYYEPIVYLSGEEAAKFLSCWCHYRGEVPLPLPQSILIRMEAMKAENQKRAYLGQGIAYDEEAFLGLLEE